MFRPIPPTRIVRGNKTLEIEARFDEFDNPAIKDRIIDKIFADAFLKADDRYLFVARWPMNDSLAVLIENSKGDTKAINIPISLLQTPKKPTSEQKMVAPAKETKLTPDENSFVHIKTGKEITTKIIFKKNWDKEFAGKNLLDIPKFSQQIIEAIEKAHQEIYNDFKKVNPFSLFSISTQSFLITKTTLSKYRIAVQVESEKDPGPIWIHFNFDNIDNKRSELAGIPRAYNTKR